MAEKEYIEREAAMKIADSYSLSNGCTLGRHSGIADDISAQILRIPAADVAPVVHAEWIPSPEGINPIKCRRCGTVAPYRMESDFNHAIGLYPYKANYCPNCGARMDGGKDG